MTMKAKMIDRMLTFLPAESVEGRSLKQRRWVANKILQNGAYHVAGQAVVTVYLGTAKPSYVTIAEGKRAASIRKVAFKDLGPETTITDILSGHAAECRFRGTWFNIGNALDTLDAPGVAIEDASDLSKALRLASKALNDSEKAVALVCECADRANDIVALPEVWKKIEFLANHLCCCGTVDSESEVLKTLFGENLNEGQAAG